MARLVLSLQGLFIKEIPLLKQRLTIGRKAQNDLQIDNLAVSGEHCAVITLLEDSFLEDLNSTNGSFINGQPVKKHALRHGDVIEVGGYSLKYYRSGLDEVSTPSNTSAQPETLPIDAPTLPPVRRERLAYLQVLNGQNAGKQLSLYKEQVRLGRAGVASVILERRQQSYYLLAVNAVVGVLINDKPLAEAEYLLAEGDLIQVAGIKVKFCFKA